MAPVRSDIAVVSLGTTPGLRRSAEAFAELVRAAGASCELVPVQIGRAGALRRHIVLVDLVESLAARRTARGVGARAVVFSAATAALLERPAVPYAMHFDSPTALNRPGWGGAWQRRRELGAMAGARLLMPWGEAAEAAIPVTGQETVRVPVPIDDLGAPVPAVEREPLVVAYAGYPRKRGLEVLCAAWAAAETADARLVVTGCTPAAGREWLARCGVVEPPGVEWAGPLERPDFLALIGRARLFVNASRREDHGLSQLEALSAGTPLVTAESPGAYEALGIARELAGGLVGAGVDEGTLAAALEAGLALAAAERGEYALRARERLSPYRPAAVLDIVERRVLPALLG